MILMTGYHLGTIPFKKVYLHGTVRDNQGRKMSKSLDNGIDPLEIAKEFGTDAGRMALIIGTAPGTDSKISREKIRGYKHFGNKLWNITRFVLTNTESLDYSQKPSLTKEDTDILTELDTLISDITNDMENMRFHLASEKTYHYIWHTYADTIIENSKAILQGGSEYEKASKMWTLYHILLTALKILHPYMPFVTEEVWSLLPHAKTRPLLMVEEWPVPNL